MDDIAIAHKDYDVRGGGEVLAEHLARTFEAPLYVGRKDTQNMPDDPDIDIQEIPLTYWQKKAIDRGGVTRSFAYWIAWQNAPIHDYDVVITSGNEPLWHVGPDEQVKLAYTHSTPRWQYDLAHETNDGTIGTIYRTAVRTIYQQNVPRPDLWVANSDLVKRRMMKYWNLADEEIRVVYPPVETEKYSPDITSTKDYYLYLGRLAGHKEVESVVEAFNQTDKRLKIAGDGPEKSSLEKLSNKNIEFCGFVSEERKAALYSGAKALIYPPKNEDFGMVPIEAMASGTPVIGVDEGFTRYQILNQQNGYLYERGKLTKTTCGGCGVIFIKS